MILEKGFDINVRTSRGTALHEAAICGKVGSTCVTRLVSQSVLCLRFPSLLLLHLHWYAIMIF